MDEFNPQGMSEPQVQGEFETPTDLPPVQSQTEGSDDFELPETSNDRTKELFQKLLQSNKELKDQLSKLASNKNSEPNAYGSVYDTFKSDPFSVEQAVESYVDEDGNVNIQQLNKDLKEAKMSALEAKALANKAREDFEVREAHAKHPYLNPQNPEFDPQFFELVKDRVLRQKFYEGKNTPLVDVADQVSSFYKPSALRTAESQKAVEEYKKAQTQIANNAPASASSRNRQDGPNLDELRAKTRLGDSNAIRERLKALGI